MLTKLALHLPAAGVDVSVVSLGQVGTLGGEIMAAGVPVRPLDMRGLADAPGAVLRLAHWIRKDRADVVQTWLYHGDLIGTFAHMAAGRGILAWNLRNSDIDLTRENGSSRRVRPLLRALSRRPTVVVANAEAAFRTHRALGYQMRREVLIPNGFDTNGFRPDPAARALRRSDLGVTNDHVVVGMVARAAPMKDHTTFLAAAAEASARDERLRFVLVGSGCNAGGRLAQSQAALALGNRVSWLGPRGDVAKLLPAFDVATLSSSCGEGFANVLGEAMACGVPCVATDVGDAAHIIGTTGHVVPPKAPSALALAWRQLADLSPAERENLGRAARARIESSFGIAAITRRYADLYVELASNTPPRSAIDGAKPGN